MRGAARDYYGVEAITSLCRLHAEQPSEMDVMVVVLSAGERQAERDLARDTVESTSTAIPAFVIEDPPGWCDD
jgi:hypothetical protein